MTGTDGPLAEEAGPLAGLARCLRTTFVAAPCVAGFQKITVAQAGPEPPLDNEGSTSIFDKRRCIASRLLNCCFNCIWTAGVEFRRPGGAGFAFSSGEIRSVDLPGLDRESDS